MTRAQVVRFDGSDLPGGLGEALGQTLQRVLARPVATPELVEQFQRKAAAGVQALRLLLAGPVSDAAPA
jgi:hypothetical protein